MTKVYLFRDPGDAACAAASRQAVIEAFGSLALFEQYFGGSMTFGSYREPTFLGVWGNRNAARFRRILRDAHGELTIVHTRPPDRLIASGVHGPRNTRAERQQLERRFAPLRSDGPSITDSRSSA